MQKYLCDLALKAFLDTRTWDVPTYIRMCTNRALLRIETITTSDLTSSEI